MIEAIELDPLWLFFGYEMEVLSNTHAIMRFTDCSAQKGWPKMGKEVFFMSERRRRLF